MAAPNEFWLLTVPKEGQTPEATFEKLRRHTDGASQGYLIQVPSLTVGTLNSLMSLSEDMDKVDASIESVVRKVERQYAEVTPKTGIHVRGRGARRPLPTSFVGARQVSA